MTGERRQIARNATTAYAGRGLLVVSVLLLTPYLFRSLGPARFGTWSVMFTIATVFTMLEASFSAAVAERVAKLTGAGDEREAGSAVLAGAAVLAVVGLLALCVTAAVAFAGDGLAAPQYRDEFRTGLLVLGVAMVVRFPCVAYGAGLRGRRRTDLFQAAEMLAVAGFAVGAVVALESGAGIVGLAVSQAGALIAGGLVFVVLLVRDMPPRALRTRAAGHRGLALFGTWALLADSMMFVAERMDTIFIAAIRGAAAAGPYAAAQKLRSGVQSLTYPLFGLLLPMAAEMRAAGREGELARRFVLATRVALQVSVPVAAALALFATDVVSVWLGPGAPAWTAEVIVVLMLVEVLAIAATPAHEILIGVGRVRRLGLFGLLDGAANVVLSILLISRYGAVGAALGTLFTSSLIGLVRIPWAATATGCTAGRLLRDGLAPAVGASVAPVGLMIGIFFALDEGPERLLLGGALGIGLAAAIGLRQAGLSRFGELRELFGRLRAPAPVVE